MSKSLPEGVFPWVACLLIWGQTPDWLITSHSLGICPMFMKASLKHVPLKPLPTSQSEQLTHGTIFSAWLNAVKERPPDQNF